jgi:hypothetical protein
MAFSPLPIRATPAVAVPDHEIEEWPSAAAIPATKTKAVEVSRMLFIFFPRVAIQKRIPSQVETWSSIGGVMARKGPHGQEKGLLYID